MSLQSNQTTTTRTSYRTVNVASPEPMTRTVISTRPVSPAQVTTTQVAQLSPVPYTMNGSYETMRYLVPVQQTMPQQNYIVVQQPMVQQPMVQQVVSPVYLQSLQGVQGMQRLSVSSQESDMMYQQQQHQTVDCVSGMSSVFSQSSSSNKSPEPSIEEEEEEEVEEEEQTVEVEEVEIVNVIQQKPLPAIERISRREVQTQLREIPEPTKLDTRYFGELLADVYRKNRDIHSYITDNVSKIRGQKYQLDSCEYKTDKDEVESLLPKGASELTKQQMRYLLQTRLTADKSMRLLLSTFSSLREELLHMSEDLRRLESEKESLERDLNFKADQARQYDSLLEAVRENNRQLQLSLKETTTAQRSLENQLMSTRSSDSSREFKFKELEGRLRALEKENEMLRQKLVGQDSSTSTMRIRTEDLSRQYNDQLRSIREEKDVEIQRLRTQITRLEMETSSTQSSSEKSLQLKISELLSMLDQRQTTISRQEEEIRRLMQEKNDSSKNVTKTIITKRYRNQYPILGLLSDDYQVTSPVKEAKTIVIERTGEMIKQEIITTP
ncbi:protein POF1B isoform X2 [Mugil cephalus]|uniref:protein POF1B isoform X2 n=2 Tax=Mugil cephalus TaxID=48193 RepID=UPI001FB64C57|nr:protein POF1B isoform X2 [Mugil cephalus]